MANPNENAIRKLMDSLGISRQEAIDIILYDSGEVDNEEAEEIDKKAKENAKEEKKSSSSSKNKKGSSLDKVKNQKAKKKVDEVKDNIIKTVKIALELNPNCKNIQEMTSTKLTFKDKQGNYYSVNITKHKEKPDGYSDEAKEV